MSENKSSETGTPAESAAPDGSARLRVVALALMFVAVAAVAILCFTEAPQRHDLDFAGYGHGFDGDAKLPRETIQAALQEARDSMKARVKTSQVLGVTQMVLQWTGFCLGAVVTVIAGYHWQSDPKGLALAELKKAFGRKAKSLRFVGVISALATVLTVAAAKTGEASASFYDRAKETQARLNTAMADLQKAKSPEEAQAVLDALSVRR